MSRDRVAGACFEEYHVSGLWGIGLFLPCGASLDRAVPVYHAAATYFGYGFRHACRAQAVRDERRAPCVAVAHAVALAVIDLAVYAVVLNKVFFAGGVEAVKIKLAVALVVAELSERDSHCVAALVAGQTVSLQRSVKFACRVALARLVIGQRRRGENTWDGKSGDGQCGNQCRQDPFCVFHLLFPFGVSNFVLS